ncbi:erythromycin esterase family protein [Saccharopolyspora sp. NPDC000359]|uniref:erythromycin esterase family protein n=1 Tax=Saccharopolyspora sp. NPDC000359 TaxID=3154251 RepID=UPI0033279946
MVELSGCDRRAFGLSAFGDVVGDARVVAVGENNHYIREFGLLRSEVVRFLVGELGFGVVALESGFAEGLLVDAWINGGAGELESVARDGFTFRHGDAVEVQELVRWLREHNSAGGRVRFAGVDVPGSGGSVLPALRPVRAYLGEHAPEHVHLVDAAMSAAQPYASANNGVAPAKYAELSAAERDAATAALTRLLLRMDSLPRRGPEHLVARHHALGALRLDEHLRELVELGQPEPPPVTSSSRDVYAAETTRLLRELHGRDQRIVVLAHNLHVQRVPMQLVPGVQAWSLGSYLAAEFGADYRAIGVTAHAGTTADMHLDDQARLGIGVRARPLEPVAEGSVEQAVGGAEPVLLDLRSATTGPTSIRHVTTTLPLDVAAAFDAVVCLPEVRPSSFVLD